MAAAAEELGQLASRERTDARECVAAGSAPRAEAMLYIKLPYRRCCSDSYPIGKC